jgi:hypothetical protein
VLRHFRAHIVARIMGHYPGADMNDVQLRSDLSG